jgi:hypothetical protein
MLSDKTMEHICRLVDDSPPFTDDDLAALSAILGREPLNVAPQFPGRGWAIFSGFVSIIAGFVGIAYPFDSIETLAWWSSLADYPRRHGGRPRVRYPHRCKEGRKGDRHRGCRDSLMSPDCPVAQLADAARIARKSVALQ